MLRLVLEEAFARREIERVELNVYTWNTPAIRSYEGLGFKTEGVRRSHQWLTTRISGKQRLWNSAWVLSSVEDLWLQFSRPQQMLHRICH